MQEQPDALIETISGEWSDWVYKSGLPPVMLDFSTELITQANNLAQAYIDKQGDPVPTADLFKDFLIGQKFIFLQYLIDAKDAISTQVIARLQADQDFDAMLNDELLYRWFTLCQQRNYQDNIAQVQKFLGSVGRQKMITPIYKALNANDQ